MKIWTQAWEDITWFTIGMMSSFFCGFTYPYPPKKEQDKNK